MSIGSREFAGVNGRRIERPGIRSSRVRLNRISTSKVSRVIGDEDQREAGSGDLHSAGVIIIAGNGVDVKIVLQSTIALEVVSEGLIGPRDIPGRRALRQEIFHPDSRWGPSRLSGLPTPNGKGHGAHGSITRVRNVVEQGEFGKHAILPNRICGGIDVSVVGSQVDNASRARLSEGLGKDQRSVKHGSYGPLVVSGLGGGGRIEGVIVNVLSTDVEEGFGEVGMRQLETEIRGPQRGTESVADPFESAARGGIRLEQMERLPDRLSQHRGRDVSSCETLDVTVVEVRREFGLRVFGGSEASEDSATIVVGISCRRMSIEPGDFSVPDIPFNTQDLQMLAKRILEPCVPNITGLPS